MQMSPQKRPKGNAMRKRDFATYGGQSSTSNLGRADVPAYVATRRHARAVASIVAAATLLAWAIRCPAGEKIVLGLLTNEADKHNVEFQQYDRMLPLYKQHEIQPVLIEKQAFYRQRWPADRILALLKTCHVVHLVTTEEGAELTPDTAGIAATAGEALERYVREGGGLFLQPQCVRYPGQKDEQYWNEFFKPFGVRILHEGVFDKTRSYEGQTIGKALFWYTDNLRPHPVTEEVRWLYLPLHGFNAFPGVPALQYSPEWETIVSGQAQAKSYRSGADQVINLDVEGTYPSVPPVAAVRRLGKGRIFCYAISPLFTGMNYGNPLWSHIVETKGDRDANRPSSMRMQLNAYRWLAEAARDNPVLGTYRPDAYRPVQFPPESKGTWRPHFSDWDYLYGAPGEGVRGIVGAHSSYAGGKGSVADYVRAAKAAGLAMVVFTDPLENHTPESFQRLKSDCDEASKAADFYACPGVEFTDSAGNRWAMLGDRVIYPPATFTSNLGRPYDLWDGKRIQFFGAYSIRCNMPATALLDYRQLRAAGSHPENLWWFWNHFPLVYDRDQLIADNYAEYLAAQRDLRITAPMSLTRIKDPADVALAAKTCFTGFCNLEQARKAFASGPGGGGVRQYVSQGPVIAQWRAINTQMEDNWQHTRGGQSVRLRFVVRSDAGIADVKVHDADQGLLRRFAGHGDKELTREFTLTHDKQHWVSLEVSDLTGRRAFSRYMLLFVYKQGLYRCGDNLNILGPLGMIWHPDRLEMLPLVKDFRNGEDYSLQGWDRGSPMCPMPRAEPLIEVRTREYGVWPDRSKLGAVPQKLMDVGLASHNIQIVTMQMDRLTRLGNRGGFSNAEGAVPQDVGDLEVFHRTHTMIAPMDRIDWFVTWNYRRYKEGSKDYRGALVWHEGEIRFRKDVTLQGQVPIPLARMACPTDLDKHWGNTFIVTDAAEGTRVAMLQSPEKRAQTKGRIRPGGYAAQMPSLVGYHAFFTLPGSDFAYQSDMPGYLQVGLGRDGQTVKAGTVMPYRFVVGALADAEGGTGLLEHTVQAMNLHGGQAGYPVAMTIGQLDDATFFFTATAQDHEALFTLGPQNLIIDLPIRVRGLEDNGCAAVYSTQHPWFRFIPVVKGTAWFQEPIDEANELWVGNVLACDHKGVKITAILDGLTEKMKPFAEIHNPTDKDITTRVFSPRHAPKLGGLSTEVTIPAGQSIRLDISMQGLRQR